MVEIGEVAPDFELRDQHGQTVRLSDHRGRHEVLVVFFPFAFTPTCTGELGELRDELAAALDDGTAVLAVSCDPVSALRVFAEQQGLQYPVLSDFWPHGKVSRAYGVFLEHLGFATRGSFLVDRAGVVRWRVVNGPGEARSLDDYRSAIAALRGGDARDAERV